MYTCTSCQHLHDTHTQCQHVCTSHQHNMGKQHNRYLPVMRTGNYISLHYPTHNSRGTLFPYKCACFVVECHPLHHPATLIAHLVHTCIYIHTVEKRPIYNSLGLYNCNIRYINVYYNYILFKIGHMMHVQKVKHMGSGTRAKLKGPCAPTLFSWGIMPPQILE